MNERSLLAADIYARLVALLYQNSRAAPELMSQAADTAIQAPDIFLEKANS